VEQHPGERAPVVGETRVDAERPVRELVEHDAFRSVAARQRDGGPVVLLAVEGLSSAVAGSETWDMAEVAFGKPLEPPQRSDDPVGETSAGVEAGERARGQRRLGEVDAPALRVTRSAPGGRSHPRPRYARRSASPAL